MRMWKVVNGRAIPMSKKNAERFLKQESEELDPKVVDSEEEKESVKEYYEQC